MKICVVGLGYVGIPLASTLAKAGHAVTGIDIDARKVSILNRGKSPLASSEKELEEMLERVIAAGALKATESYDECREADVIVVCVDTPVDPETRKPDYEALENALGSVAKSMRNGVLISIESTLSPGTMKNLVKRVLERDAGLKAHEEFHLVHCPERVTAGRLLQNLATLDRVVGGENEAAREKAMEIYSEICSGRLLETNWVNAELSKTVENAYRDIQLAFANEVALICEQHGGDAFEVRDLVNASPGRDMLLPGPGVGGHCIPKDTWLLISSVSNGAKLLMTARDVNEGMSQHVVGLILQALETIGQKVEGSRIVLLGGAYRENIGETTNSPGLKLYRMLVSSGAEVRLHDPHIPELDEAKVWRDLERASEGADCLVLVTAHEVYRSIDWETLGREMNHRTLVDCRGFIPRDIREGAGFRYFGLGRAAT